MSLIRSFLGDPISGELWAPSGLSSSSSEISTFANAQIDWKETAEAHVFKADLPGVKKEEVKVEIEEGKVLQISGERSVEKEEKNDKWHRVERGRGKFQRRFRLPENAKVDEVEAAMENGVLTVTIPKTEEKKPVSAGHRFVLLCKLMEDLCVAKDPPFLERRVKVALTWKRDLAFFNELWQTAINPKATSTKSPKSDDPNSKFLRRIRSNKRHNPVCYYTRNRLSSTTSSFQQITKQGLGYISDR